MSNLRTILLCFSLAFIVTDLVAQVYSGVNNSDVSRELRNRGISESEFRLRITEAGLNIDSVAYFTPLELSVLEGIIINLEEDVSLDPDSIPRSSVLLKDTILDSLAQDSINLSEEQLQIRQDSLPPVTRYGQAIFRDKVISQYNDLSVIKAPASYVVGPGDEISISIWGRSTLDEKHVVGPDGSVKIYGGKTKIFVKGLTLDQTREKLSNAYRENYTFSQGQFDVSLSYSRTVQVNVYGEVYSPGPVTLSAVNSAFVALAEANGPTDIGSLRKIQLIRSDGKREILDVYKFLNNPNPSDNLYLQDGDVILVPPAENIVTLAGAVRRPFLYEMTQEETLEQLIQYGGGFLGNADKRFIRLQRFTDDLLKIYDVDYRAGEADRFLLNNGDSIIVNSLDSVLIDFVEIEGAVKQSGVYQLDRDMRVSDLLQKSKLKQEARTDIAFIQRINPDSTVRYIELNIDQILKDQDSPSNIFLQSKDKLDVWYLKSFADDSEIAVTGAIRVEGSFPYDVSNSVQLREAILLSGGLRRDASDLAIIHRRDPLNPKNVEYVTITNLSEIITSNNDDINVILNPFDSIHVYSDLDLIEEAVVTIEGAVANPGEFQYGDNMTLKDLFVLSGGIKMNGAKNRIEISRVIIQNNEPTSIAIYNLTINDDYEVIGGIDEPEYLLSPFDVVTVRYVPDFELQKRVKIKGEVIFPGPYTILNDNERLSDLIERSGGLTGEAFPSGATLIRTEDNLGSVVIKLDEVMKSERSEFNFILKNGDIITVPKQKEFVTIEGATKAETVLSDAAVNLNNRIHVPFTSNRRAMYYINEYAGGLSQNADRNGIFVEYPNGEVKRSSSILGITTTPKVRKGSTVKVREKTAEDKDVDESEKVDWGQIIGDSLTQALPLILVILSLQ